MKLLSSMLGYNKIRFILVLAFLLFFKFNYAQFYFLEDAGERLEVEFLRRKIEIEKGSTFFNTLKINNPSNRSIEFQANFSYPTDWSFIGQKNQRILLGPNDSILIPFRGAPSISAKGDIGYAIVASVSDLEGNTLKNEYSFVNIPKLTSVRVRSLSKINYIDNNSNTATVELLIANNGNTDEVFYMEVNYDNSLTTPGIKDQTYKDEIQLAPYTDSIIKLPIIYDESKNLYKKKFHAVKIKATTVDTTIISAVWLKLLESNFYNKIPSKYSMLNLDLTFSNIFKGNTTLFRAHLYGNVFFKNSTDFGYDVRNYNNEFFNSPWENGRFVFFYNSKNFNVKLGDIGMNFEQSMFGRGALTVFKYGKNTLTLLASSGVSVDRNNFGGSFSRGIAKLGNVLVGGSYVQDNNLEFNSSLGYVSSALKFKRLGVIRTKFGVSSSNYDLLNGNDTIVNGFGIEAFNSNKLLGGNYYLNFRYEQPSYSGILRGKLQFTGNYFYPLNNKSSLTFSYSFHNNKPSSIINGVVSRDIYSLSETSRILYSIKINNNTNFTLGPNVSREGSNQFYGYSVLFDYQDLGYHLHSSLRFRLDNNSSLQLLYKGGGNTVINYPSEIFDNGETSINKNWYSMVLSLNYTDRIWGAILRYYHGPYTLNQHFSYFSEDYYSQNISIFPYININLFNDYLEVASKLNYSYDIASAVNRMNLMTEFNLHATKNLLLSFLITYNYQATEDQITGEKYTYSNTYFEFRVGKKFNFKQPHYQYHNLELIFFKDLNGNNVKDDDEPAMDNVIVNISNDEKRIDDMDFNTAVYFMGSELLSDMKGRVKYDNIPNGYYKIEYYPLNQNDGAFSSSSTVDYIYIGDDKKLYVPFFENNKIFGKVVLQRSKLSNLGIVEPANIKVTAEDSYGKKHTTLTNQKGEFLIYVPNVDKYKLRINNIFFENFELEQNDFEVQLNGYRQFEVNFVFNEKKRRINFTSSYEYGSSIDGPGIEIVRRTNLNGTVKDATTLKPLVAKVKVVNSKGDEITNVNSGLKTGIYTSSFIAGNDYSVEIFADDYWFHAEKLYSNQIVTFKNLRKDVLLKAITVGAIIPMKMLNYEAGSYEIPAMAFPELERLMSVLKKNPRVKISVHGHADDLEILDSQQDLALERAKLIAKYLIANGYNRVKYVGHSNTKPMANNDTEDGRKLNRRVEIVVTGK